MAQLRFHPDLNVVFVSMGTPEEAEDFRIKNHSPHPFICDPDRLVYAAFGLGRGTGKQVFNPRVFSRGFGATLRGHWVGLAVGDPWQMPGVFLIETDGRISWEYRSIDIADTPGASVIVGKTREGESPPL